MKLNYKRTLCVGFAFFLICAFWQAYDHIIPLILTNKFGMSQTFSGVIMALDNCFALFMLPIFGALSDKTKSKMGRRTPYIIIGTIIAALAFMGLSFADNMQLKNIGIAAELDNPTALETIYDSEKDTKLMTPDGKEYVLGDLFTREEFAKIKSQYEENGKLKTTPEYTSYVVPARQSYVNKVAKENKTPLILFVLLLLVSLVSMCTFRSPAVALMPDVTIKPLRSKANAIINLMGTAGGILILLLGIVCATSNVKNSMMNYFAYFAAVAGLMILSLVVFLLTVREPQFVKEMHEESVRLGIEEEEAEEIGTHKLSKEERRSMIFLLASIVLWFFGYNAVTSKYSVYAANILNKDYNLTLMIAQGAAIVSYIPVGIISSKLGRKKTILAGIVMLAGAFALGSFVTSESAAIVMYAIFALAGIGWASINVNSFPMVVEMCTGADVGRYTGYYYTASMAAQSLTPMFSGLLMDNFGMKILFPYAAVFSALAFFTMLCVKHGDSKVEAKTGLEAYGEMDD